LTNYTAALDEKTGEVEAQSMSELAQAARTPAKRLKRAGGIGFTLGSILGWQEWKYTYNYDYNYDYGNLDENLDTIAAKIAALDDSDESKAVLTAAVERVSNRLGCGSASREDADLDALADAVKEAREDLVAAAF
jgi:hypothetical protein